MHDPTASDGLEVPEAAVEAALNARLTEYHSACGHDPYVGEAEEIESDVRIALTAAVPILHRAWLEGLIAKYEAGRAAYWAGKQRPVMFGGTPFPDVMSAEDFTRWLRAELEQEKE